MRGRRTVAMVAVGLVGGLATVGAVIVLVVGSGEQPLAPVAPALVVTPASYGGTGASSPSLTATSSGGAPTTAPSPSAGGHDDHPSAVPWSVETLDDDHG